MKPNSVRFAVIGDSGTGERPQYDVAGQMVAYRGVFPYDFVIMLGDNIYGHKSPEDFRKKFELPYKPLLDAGVKFYASLGNHDETNERLYKPFNMDGKRYYSFKKGNAEFFVLDSNYMDGQQMEWITNHLHNSTAQWKICYFHHPPYSHSRMHGSDLDLGRQLEPIFVREGVNVVFSGHEHVYERITPQKGITYFVLGASGQLRNHDLGPSTDTAKGFDTNQVFGMTEIAGDQLFFEVVSRAGAVVDFCEVDRLQK